MNYYSCFICFLGFKRPSLTNYEDIESPQKRIEKWLRDFDAIEADTNDQEETGEKEAVEMKATKCDRKTKATDIHVHIVM